MNKKQVTGGSGGAGGYGFQASVTALTAVHVLATRALDWLGEDDIPIALEAETGGPGDDLEVRLESGIRVFVQVKRGLRADKSFLEAMLDLSAGLQADRGAHGVLLVDPSASGPIRNELPKELRRLGEGREDGLKKLTRKLQCRMTEAGHDLREVASRLHIVIRDLDSNSQGTSGALDHLGRILLGDARRAWSFLQKEALELIARRGRWDRESLVKCLEQAGIPVRGVSPSSEGWLRHYRDWLRQSTDHFHVPGLGVDRQIQSTWFAVRALCPVDSGPVASSGDLNSVLKRYREWGRREPSIGEPGVHMEDILVLHDRCVVVGGPGSGKSTLAKRLTHQLSAAGKTVLRVRLRDVSRGSGHPFEDAILRFAADGAGIPPHVLGEILSAPDYLIADGLDECAQDCPRIAEALVGWAAGHPDCRIVVTTRAAGHHESLLPGWRHFELLPLGKGNALQCAELLLGHSETDSWETSDVLTAFNSNLEQDTFFALAARSPLLIGFLLSLVIEGQEFGQTRAELYGNILQNLQRRDRSDRPVDTLPPAVSSARFLEVFGWLLQCDSSLSFEQLLERSGEVLAPQLDTRPLRAAEWAERTFSFWEQRGVLEAVAVADLKGAAFVHLAFQEFAAGKFVARLPDDRFSEVVRDRRKDPNWRETLLLAGARNPRRIVEELLSLDDPTDPTSEEAILAAAGLVEAANVPRDLVIRVIENLSARLQSTIPAIAMDSAAAILDLIPHRREVLGSLGQSLAGHEQPWTMAIGLTICAAAGRDYVDLDLLERHYPDTESLFSHGGSQGGVFALPAGSYARIRRELLFCSTELLCTERPGPDTSAKITAVLDAGRMTLWEAERVRAIAREHGIEPELTQLEMWMRDVAGNLLAIPDARNSDRALLKSIQRTFASVPSAVESTEPLVHLGALLEALDVGACPVGQYLRLDVSLDEEALSTVIRGAAMATDLDPARLRQDADRALELLDQDENLRLYSIAPDASPPVDWHRVANDVLDPVSLARALDQPCLFVVNTAAQLIDAGACAGDIGDRVRERLKDSTEYGLTGAAALAEVLWGDDAGCVLLDRAEGELSAGCDALLDRLPELVDAPAASRARCALLRGLYCEGARIVAGAARGLRKLPPDSALAVELRKAFDAWRKLERPYPVRDGVIPFSPRNDVFLACEQHGSFCEEELLALCGDPRIRESAVGAVVDRVQSDPPLLRRLLERIRLSPILVNLLEALSSKAGEKLAGERKAFCALLGSEHREVRQAATRLLASPVLRWNNSDELAAAMLQDGDPSIRNAAVVAMKVLARDSKSS